MSGFRLCIINIMALLFAITFFCEPVVAVAPWNGESTEIYAGGDGTKDSPYQIENAGQLAYMAKQVNDGEAYVDTYFVLTADLDLNHKKWIPIGTSKTRFQGHIDGRGHSISGLYIKKRTKAQGLFAYTQNAELSNISLLAVDISAKNYVGGLVGVSDNTSIFGCTVSGEIQGGNYVGGFIGREMNAVGDQGDAGKLVHSCINKAKVTGAQYVGGFAGFYKGMIYNSNNYGDVAGVQFVGGICGYGCANGCVNHGTIGGVQDIGGICGYGNGKLSVTECLNLGSIYGNVEVGGICGYVPVGAMVDLSSSYGHVSGGERVGGLCGVGAFYQSFHMGTVTGDQYVGGLSGCMLGGAAGYSYNRGMVKGSKDAGYVGGIVGYMMPSSNGTSLAFCYNTGRVSGKERTGGVVGYNAGQVTDTYYLVNQATVGIGAGNSGDVKALEISEMKSEKLLKVLNKEEQMYLQIDGNYPTLIHAREASNSNMNTAGRVDKVTAFLASSKKGVVTLTWTPLQRVTGYEIYQYDRGKKSYVKKKTIAAIKVGAGTEYFTNRYVVGKLKKKTTYKFRIRAYKEVAGKKYYGKYQMVKVKSSIFHMVD